MPAGRLALTAFDDYRAMLADEVRMGAYRAAIESAVQPGDTVVDLGAGLGILSFLALRAGAAHVFAIEKSDAIDLARDIARHNGVAERITFLHGNSLDCELPTRADVLVSETLGSFGVEENALPFLIDARDRLLKPGGRMLPEGLRLWLAPVESAALYAERVEFWRDVAGVDMSPAAALSASKMSVATVPLAALLGRPRIYQVVDLRQATEATLEGEVTLPIERPGTAHGLAGWFEARLTAEHYIDTGPHRQATHWQQAFLPFRAPVPLQAGDLIQLRLRVGGKARGDDNTVIAYEYACSDDQPLLGR